MKDTNQVLEKSI